MPSYQHQAGLSLVETMVGIAVGLFIVGGALKLFIDNLDSNRRLLVETRVNQDLRAAADLIARDLRRASYWQDAASGVWQPAASGVIANPHASVVNTASEITYSYDGAASAAGFKLEAGKIRTFSTGAWQDVTDPSTMTVTLFNITPVARDVCLLSRCPCPTGSAPCPPEPACLPGDPVITVRQFNLSLQARANSDPNVIRRIEETVRVRNDALSGACPGS